MTTTITAIDQNGVFRPAAPLSMAEGMAVRLVVSTETGPDIRPMPEDARARIGAIAATVEPTGQPETTSMDHDKLLHGDPYS